MSIYSQKYLIVVRSNGERTLNECLRILKTQNTVKAEIKVLTEKPFEKALRKMFQFAKEGNYDFLISLDADILLSFDGLGKLLAEARRLDKSEFGVQAYVYDKILACLRPAGPRVYRAELAELAIQNIPLDGKFIRPEARIVERMRNLGFGYKRSQAIVGVHDFEQYYSDLYRKSFVHAKKHEREVLYLLKRINRLYDVDDDYKIIKQGFLAGLDHKLDKTQNREQIQSQFENVMKQLELTEKNLLFSTDPKIEVLVQNNVVIVNSIKYKNNIRGKILKGILSKLLNYSFSIKKYIFNFLSIKK